MKKKSLAAVLVFLGVIGGISLVSLGAKDREFSENENRYLAQLPSVSWNDIYSGDFQDGFEEYLKDHVAFRDEWITVKTFIQKATGNTDIGGAYVGKDGYDFEKITPDDVDKKLVMKNTRAVNEYLEYCSKAVGSDNCYFMLVPTAGLINGDKLPKNAILFDQESYIDDIKSKITQATFVDVREDLKRGSDKQLYYKTDHHWTTDGAFIAYKQWKNASGKGEVLDSRFEEKKVTDKFRGSLYSKILDVDSDYDDIMMLSTGDEDKYTVIADGKDIGGIYQEDKLSEKDKYAYFMGGNYGEASIHNPTASGKGNLLIIKDSFANSFVPMLATDYENIYMVDLRYYQGDMSSYISENNISEVMVLYNISNFISDKNLFKLTRNIGE